MTSLIGGTRVPKYHARIEAYGTIDELISWMGLIRDQDIRGVHRKALLEVQDRLMTCASLLANDSAEGERKLPHIAEADIRFLEDQIDAMEQELEPLTSFILPGGDPVVSYCHIARNICRRAERQAGKLGPEVKDLEIVLAYLNRLSDYMFVLSRKLGSELGADEIPWNPRL